MPEKWTSPYEKLAKDRRFTLSVDVDLVDHRLVKSITCTHGAISLFIQTLYHDIAEYARANNLSVIDSESFIDYLRQRAVAHASQSASARDGRDSNARVRQDAPASADQPSSVSKAVKGGQRGRKTS